MPLGILFCLTAAFMWSTSSLLVKAQAATVDTLSFNAFRVVIGAVFFFCLLPFFGGFQLLAQLNPATLLVLSVSVILGFCIGDSIYFWSMTVIGASRAMPISGVYPVFTWLLAIPLLGEQITLPALFGTVLVITALYLLSKEHAPEAGEANDMLITPPDARIPPRVSGRLRYLGIAAAIFAALMWSISTTLLRFGIQMQDPVTLYDNLQQSVSIGAFRMFVASLVLVPSTQWLKGSQVWSSYRGAALPKLLALAIYSTGIGSLFFIMGVALAGAARAALLNSASPVIGVILSWLFLREAVTRRVWAGTALAVIGVWLVLT
ncbi:MAG TPA: DMT family transporter [Anaerolineae bacterium]|nr:DMT family transporter [Anaerolineae bacterium]